MFERCGETRLASVVAGLIVVGALCVAATPGTAVATTCGWTMFHSQRPAGSGAEYLNAVSASATNDAWAVGAWLGPGSAQPLALRWRGSWWKVKLLGPAGVRLTDVVDLARDDAWAVGQYDATNYDVPPPSVVEHWDGRGWNVVPAPGTQDGWTLGGFAAASATSASDVWVVGTAEKTINGFVAVGPAILHWDGSSWNVTVGPETSGLESVIGLSDVLAVSADDVWAVGTVWVVSLQGEAIVHFDGTSWQIVQSGPLGQLDGLGASAASNVWTVGTNLAASADGVERWDGGTWSLLPNLPPPEYGGVDGLDALAVQSPTSVFVSYLRLNAGGNYQVSYWDGSAWTLQTVVDPAVVTWPHISDLTSIPGTNDAWAAGERGHHHSRALLARSTCS